MADLEIDAAAWLAASDPLAFCKVPEAIESKLPLDRILNLPKDALQLETGG